MKNKAYFLSDIHLESEEDSNFFTLQKFFDHVLKDQDCTHLFLLGDIFDLWVADHSYFKLKFKKTLETIKALADRGIEIHYFEGNHDLDLVPYFASRGISVHRDPLLIPLGSQLFRLEHGDQMDPEDKGYLFLRWLLRTPILRALGRCLPGFMVQWIGQSMSSTSRKYTDRLRSNLGKDLEIQRKKIFEKMRTHVLHLLKSNMRFDYIVAGHVHEEINEKISFQNKEVRVINLGSWLGERKPYGVYEQDKGFHLENIL